MAEEHKKEEERDDASAGTLLKTVIDRLDAMSKRIDAAEEKREDKSRKDSEEEERKDRARKDSKEEDRKDESEEDERKDARRRVDAKHRKDESEEEEEREDKARKDAKEEDEDDSTVFYRGNKAPKSESKKDSKEEEERKDSKRKDAKEEKEEEREDAIADSVSKMAAKLERVERMLPAQLSDEDRAKFSEIQARADSVFHAFGSSAPQALQGETILAYRQRLANAMKAHSKTFKDVNVYAIGDSVAFKAIEDVIYNDAYSVAMSPSTTTPGTLRPISKKSGGHEFITYVGDPAAWMNDFAGPVRQYVTAINTPNQGQR